MSRSKFIPEVDVSKPTCVYQGFVFSTSLSLYILLFLLLTCHLYLLLDIKSTSFCSYKCLRFDCLLVVDILSHYLEVLMLKCPSVRIHLLNTIHFLLLVTDYSKYHDRIVPSLMFTPRQESA